MERVDPAILIIQVRVTDKDAACGFHLVPALLSGDDIRYFISPY
jgi:hypothetical protein